MVERPVRNPNVPQYNINNLRRLNAADNAARESGSEDTDRTLTSIK